MGHQNNLYSAALANLSNFKESKLLHPCCRMLKEMLIVSEGENRKNWRRKRPHIRKHERTFARTRKKHQSGKEATSSHCSPPVSLFSVGSLVKSHPPPCVFNPSCLSGALQSPREPLAHSFSHGDAEEAPGLRRLPGHDLLGRRQRRHHGAEQRRALQPQDQPVVPSGGHDVQEEWGEDQDVAHLVHSVWPAETLSTVHVSVFVGGLGCGERSADGSRRFWWDDVPQNNWSLWPWCQHVEVSDLCHLGDLTSWPLSSEIAAWD